jgi:hypothetical protein
VSRGGWLSTVGSYWRKEWARELGRFNGGWRLAAASKLKTIVELSSVMGVESCSVEPFWLEFNENHGHGG